jgi:hypothetical protein
MYKGTQRRGRPVYETKVLTSVLSRAVSGNLKSYTDFCFSAIADAEQLAKTFGAPPYQALISGLRADRRIVRKCRFELTAPTLYLTASFHLMRLVFVNNC